MTDGTADLDHWIGAYVQIGTPYRRPREGDPCGHVVAIHFENERPMARVHIIGRLAYNSSKYPLDALYHHPESY